MNSIQIFSNDAFTVSTTRDENGTVWFVAKDIVEALEYSEATISNMEKTIGMVPDDWKGRYPTPTVTRGKQEMWCLTEQGVYFFLGRSDKPKALPYQMWIAGDVVPSIRKTGGYSAHGAGAQGTFAIEGARLILETAGIKDSQLVLALDKVYRKCTGFSMLEATGIELVAPDKKQLLTPTEIGRQLGISAREVNKLLAYAGYQHNIDGKWEPLGEGERYAEMLDTNKRHSDGTPMRQLKWNSDILFVVESLQEDCA